MATYIKSNCACCPPTVCAGCCDLPCGEAGSFESLLGVTSINATLTESWSVFDQVLIPSATYSGYFEFNGCEGFSLFKTNSPHPPYGDPSNRAPVDTWINISALFPPGYFPEELEVRFSNIWTDIEVPHLFFDCDQGPRDCQTLHIQSFAEYKLRWDGVEEPQTRYLTDLYCSSGKVLASDIYSGSISLFSSTMDTIYMQGTSTITFS